MLKKCADSHYVLSPMETTVFYDEADCDGSCLMGDIASVLEIPEDTEPLEANEKS